MMKTILIASFFLFAMTCFSQPFMEWEDHQDYLLGDEPGVLIKIDSGNRIYTSNNYGSLSRYTTDGDTVWTKPSLTVMHIQDMIIDGNDDIICIGHTSQSGGEWIVVKYDSLGNELWITNVDGPLGSYDRPNAVDIDENNDIYITGIESNNFQGTFYTAKVSSAGSILWETAYVGPYLPEEHEGLDISVYDSNNIYAIGLEYRNSTTTDMMLIKYNGAGDTVWTRRFSWNEEFGGFQQTLDRGLLIDTDVNGNVYVVSQKVGPTRYATLKYDQNGNRLWVEPLYESIYDSYPKDLVVDLSGNSYVTGRISNGSFAFPASDSLFVIKRNSAGSIDWLYRYENAFACEGLALELAFGHIYACGYEYDCNGCTRYHITIKLDDSGNLVWDYLEDSNLIILDGGTNDVAVDSFGGVYLTGCDESPSFSKDTYQYKLFDCDANITIVESNNVLSTDFVANGYQWVDCDNNYAPIVGETNSTFSPGTDGNYAVISSFGSCSDTSNCINITLAGIDEFFGNKPQLVKVCDFMGRQTPVKQNVPLLYYYSDGTVRRIMKVE